MSEKKFRKKCVGKNPGGQKFWQRGGQGEGRFHEILSCPPPKIRVAPQMPPPKFRDLAPPLEERKTNLMSRRGKAALQSRLV